MIGKNKDMRSTFIVAIFFFLGTGGTNLLSAPSQETRIDSSSPLSIFQQKNPGDPLETAASQTAASQTEASQTEEQRKKISKVLQEVEKITCTDWCSEDKFVGATPTTEELKRYGLNESALSTPVPSKLIDQALKVLWRPQFMEAKKANIYLMSKEFFGSGSHEPLWDTFKKPYLDSEDVFWNPHSDEAIPSHPLENCVRIEPPVQDGTDGRFTPIWRS